MKSKVALITCYFGKLPNYFQLWLDSCNYNKEFSWFVFTDDASQYNYPENVQKIVISFKKFIELIKKKTLLNVHINDAYKICDFKPLYGFIFDQYLKGYTHWGHCDIDIIWGDLSLFVNDALLMEYDRLFKYGHLSIYKNTQEVNQNYKLPYSGLNYKEILCSPNHFGFDEMRGINLIYKENALPWYKVNVSADIDFYHYDLRVKHHKNYKGQYFVYDNGKLFQFKSENEMIQEYPYLHLQKRKMKYEKETLIADRYYILPDCFSNDLSIEVELLTKIKHHLKIHINVLKIKLKWNYAWKMRITVNNRRGKNGSSDIK